MNLNVSGIYMITNIINDKNYIGSASNFRYRRKHHRYYLNTDKHHNKYLQRSWDKYGENAFVFILLERCSKEQLIEREQIWLNIYNCFAPDNGYNIRTKAENSLGLKHSAETKLKMSKNNAKTNRKIDKWPCSDGWKCKCERCSKQRSDFQSEYRRVMKDAGLWIWD